MLFPPTIATAAATAAAAVVPFGCYHFLNISLFFIFTDTGAYIPTKRSGNNNNQKIWKTHWIFIFHC